MQVLDNQKSCLTLVFIPRFSDCTSGWILEEGSIVGLSIVVACATESGWEDEDAVLGSVPIWVPRFRGARGDPGRSGLKPEPF